MKAPPSILNHPTALQKWLVSTICGSGRICTGWISPFWPEPEGPCGAKGVGEAGAIPTGAAFAQAVEDALAGSGLEITEIPLSPGRLFELMQGSQGGVG